MFTRAAPIFCPIAPTFTPADLFTGGTTGGWWDFTDAAAVWADAARTTPATIGGSILGVTDKSGTGRHLSGSGAGILRQNGGGFDYGDFNGARYMSCTNGFVGDAAGWFCMAGFRAGTVAGTQQVMDSDQVGLRVGQLIILSGTAGLTLTFNSDTTNNALLGAGTVSTTTSTTVSVYRTPTVETTKQDGVVVNSVARTKAPASFNATTVFLGCGLQGTSTPGRLYTGRIYSALMLNRAPTATEIANCEAWFAAHQS